MARFNLSAWAISHQPLVLFMILVLAGAGVYSYLNLGRAEVGGDAIALLSIDGTVDDKQLKEIAALPGQLLQLQAQHRLPPVRWWCRS